MAETLRYLLQTKAARGTRLVTSAAVAWWLLRKGWAPAAGAVVLV
jgi:hypothetical protein